MIHTLKTMYAEKWKVIKMKKLMGRVAEPVFLYQFWLQALTVHMRDFAWKLLFLLSEGLYTLLLMSYVAQDYWYWGRENEAVVKCKKWTPCFPGAWRVKPSEPWQWMCMQFLMPPSRAAALAFPSSSACLTASRPSSCQRAGWACMKITKSIPWQDKAVRGKHYSGSKPLPRGIQTLLMFSRRLEMGASNARKSLGWSRKGETSGWAKRCSRIEEKQQDEWYQQQQNTRK